MPTRRLRSFAAFCTLTLLAACSVRNAACGRSNASAEQTEAAAAIAAGGGGVQTFKIVFLGDSLTAGLGLTTQEAFPALLQDKFEAEGYSNVESVNAGVSGDTTAGATRRIDQALEPGTKILVVALGGNDALRGLSTMQTHDNLAAIIEAAQAKGIQILLAGMLAPTNLGVDYRDKFAEVFPDLARAYHQSVNLVPFLLEGVGGNPDLNQPDGIHPNAAGAKAIAELLYPKLRTMVDSIGGGG